MTREQIKKACEAVVSVEQIDADIKLLKSNLDRGMFLDSIEVSCGVPGIYISFSPEEQREKAEAVLKNLQEAKDAAEKIIDKLLTKL